MLGELYQIKQDFRSAKANLWALQKLLCNHVLGEDKDPLPGVESYQGHQDSESGIFGLITGLRFNERPVDSVGEYGENPSFPSFEIHSHFPFDFL